jgi:hypothetical protein
MSGDLHMIMPMIGAKTGDAWTTRDFNKRVRGKVDAALTKDGIESLYAPRWHSCIHESGHAVSYVLDGFGVASVRVRSRWFNNKETWGRLTTPRQKIPDSGTASSIAEDLLALRQHTAGILCEICFLPDVRAGSSVDEVAIGQMLCENVAVKTGWHPHAVMQENAGRLLAAFRRNESAVRAIAGALMRDKVLRGAKLAMLLKEIK